MEKVIWDLGTVGRESVSWEPRWTMCHPAVGSRLSWGLSIVCPVRVCSVHRRMPFPGRPVSSALMARSVVVLFGADGWGDALGDRCEVGGSGWVARRAWGAGALSAWGGEGAGEGVVEMSPWACVGRPRSMDGGARGGRGSGVGWSSASSGPGGSPGWSIGLRFPYRECEVWRWGARGVEGDGAGGSVGLRARGRRALACVRRKAAWVI